MLNEETLTNFGMREEQKNKIFNAIKDLQEKSPLIIYDEKGNEAKLQPTLQEREIICKGIFKEVNKKYRNYLDKFYNNIKDENAQN